MLAFSAAAMKRFASGIPRKGIQPELSPKSVFQLQTPLDDMLGSDSAPPCGNKKSMGCCDTVPFDDVVKIDAPTTPAVAMGLGHARASLKAYMYQYIDEPLYDSRVHPWPLMPYSSLL